MERYIGRYGWIQIASGVDERVGVGDDSVKITVLGTMIRMERKRVMG